MALVFGAATSDRVTIADSTSTDISSGTSFTWILWHYPTTQTATRRLASKPNNPVTTQAVIQWWSVDTNDYSTQVGRVTVNALANTTGVNVPLNEWAYTAMTYSEGNGIKVYNGSLTTIAVEASYTTNTVGTGATVNMNNDLIYGNDIPLFSLAYQGRISFFGMWNREMSLGEIKEQQFFPHNTSGCVVFQAPGFNGTSTQPDWSGNSNSGTVSGATVDAGFPLKPMNL